jgi:hypothetical protein
VGPRAVLDALVKRKIPSAAKHTGTTAYEVVFKILPSFENKTEGV